jgi:surface antigen
MRVWSFGVRVAALGLGIMAIAPLTATDAFAARSKSSSSHETVVRTSALKSPVMKLQAPVISTKLKLGSKTLPVVNATLHGSRGLSKQVLLKGGKARYAGSSLQCVPFARSASGIQIKGNAANWWDAANGVYARGQAPEAGSVLNFRATGAMRLGHVAVVKAVLNSREIEIDHANWAGPGASKGGVSRAISVMDVSANNDWSSVRVGLGHSGNFGSVYPTYGFIYDRPDSGMIASAPAHIRYEEVAEAPSRSFR